MLCVCLVQSDLNSWDVGRVTNMEKMFWEATKFNVRFPILLVSIFSCLMYAGSSVCVDLFCDDIVV